MNNKRPSLIATSREKTNANSAVLSSVNSNASQHVDGSRWVNIVEELKFRPWLVAGSLFCIVGLGILFALNTISKHQQAKLVEQLQKIQTLSFNTKKEKVAPNSAHATVRNDSSARIVNTAGMDKYVISKTENIDDVFNALAPNPVTNTQSDTQLPVTKTSNDFHDKLTPQSTEKIRQAPKSEAQLHLSTPPRSTSLNKIQSESSNINNSNHPRLAPSKEQTYTGKPGDVAVISALLANNKVPTTETTALNKQKPENGKNFQDKQLTTTSQNEASAPNLSQITQHGSDLDIKLMQCESLGFFEKQTCLWKACEHYWGKSEACSTPANQPNIFNQPR